MFLMPSPFSAVNPTVNLTCVAQILKIGAIAYPAIGLPSGEIGAGFNPIVARELQTQV